MENTLAIKPNMDNRIRLETLITIRWLAVAGQTLAVTIVAYILNFQLPLTYCLLAIAGSAWLNIFLRLRYPLNHRLQGSSAIILLAYDIFQLAFLLFLTGGLQNPFAFLLVVPVIISATIQSIHQTITLGGLVIAVSTGLVFFRLPLPWHPTGTIELPLLYVSGIWSAIVASMVFTAMYVFRVADESRKLAGALAATELVLQREQHLSNLDGLAAAAAHELGTPLATIALVSKEMMRELDPEAPLMEDAKLLRNQAERCREILKTLSSLSDGDGHMASLTLPALVEEVCDPHRNFGIELVVKLHGVKPEPVFHRNPAILYGLGNLIENAVDFARTRVVVHAEWTAAHVVVRVHDDGKGFKADMLERMGEPFVTTRGPANAETGGGLGLGLFIAKTLLERSGASMTFANASYREGRGALVTVKWPRERIEQPDWN